MGGYASSVKGNNNVSIERGVDLRVNTIRNKQQTDRVDIKRRNRGVLRTVQQGNVEDGGDKVGTTRDLSMT